MANEKENLEIKKKPQEVSGKELDKVAGGFDICHIGANRDTICLCGKS